MIRILTILTFFTCLMTSCNQNSESFHELTSLEYTNPDRLSLFVFMSPECPLCENYTKDFTDMRQAFSKDSLHIYGVFSGEKLYTEQQILSFKSKYKLEMDFVLDKDYEIAKYFKAEVTPECFLVDTNGAVVYSGKLDNWLGKLGRRRRYVSQFYVKDAIHSVFSGDSIKVKHTEAIGCLLQYPKP